jgi:hypothetical protein
MEWPTTNSSVPHGPTVSPSDWAIPESTATPVFFPQATEETNEEDEDGCSDISPGHMTHRQNVPSGQRHALLSHRNTMFEHHIGRNTRVSINDGEDHADEKYTLTSVNRDQQW